MNNFSALEPWHKVQVIIILTLIIAICIKISYPVIKPLIHKLHKAWRQYKQHLKELAEWEEQQLIREDVWAKTYNNEGKIINLDERIREGAKEIRKATERRG